MKRIETACRALPRWSRRTVHLLAVLLAFSVVLTIAPRCWGASKFKVLYSFKGGTDGWLPGGTLTLRAGKLYGSTVYGGNNQPACDGYGCGTVFELTNAGGQWTENILYAFCPQSGCSDGANPNGSLIFDAAGNLYGTTIDGGNQQCSVGESGCGVVFELTPPKDGHWTENVLYNFQSYSSGASPNGGLLFDKVGNLYGTTSAAGSGNRSGDIYYWSGGIVFELSPGSGSWTENVLYSFCSQPNCSDGNAPYAGLMWGDDGALYGTTAFGGTGFEVCAGGCGTAFMLTPKSNGGWKEEVLKAMRGTDGVQPVTALVADRHGNLYGTTQLDGAFGYGTVFQSTYRNGHWKYHVLYNFRTGSFYGSEATQLVLDKAGNIYGTIWTSGDGNCDGLSCGLVYKLTPGPDGQWSYSVVHSFSGSDGGLPSTGLIMDGKGNLYGGTEAGGAAGQGVIYEITP